MGLTTSAHEPNRRLNCRSVERSPADRSAVEGFASKSCALNWDNHGCSHSGKRRLAERYRSLPRDAACRRVQGVVGVSAMDSIAGCFHLYSQKSPSRTARPEQTGGCAAPAVLIPERFRIYRCVAPSVAARFCARSALQSADRSLAVQEPERVWEVAPSVELEASNGRGSLSCRTHVVVSWL
jgi:hypothetical protein